MENNQTLSTNLLHLSADKQQVLLFITPVQSPLTTASLADIFYKSVYREFKLNTAGIDQALLCFQRLNSQSERESIAIADRLDAQLNITLDPLKIVAKAQIISAYGGSAVTAEQLKNKLDELQINTGIDNKTFALLLEKSQQAKPGSTCQVTIARGKLPVHGKDAYFKRLVDTPMERLLKPEKIEGGRVDMRNLGQLITVKPGNALMRKILHSEGMPGITVTGNIIEHTPGKDFALEAGKNSKLCPSDPNLLIATISGIPKVLDHGMMVDDVLTIENVNVGYGNINYEGSVIVKGDICDGMKVVAAGDISVSGFIESAHIECGGDLIVGKGILGHKIELGSHNFSCEINCKGSVIANFSQYSKINTGLDLNIHKQLLHCHATCGGDINVKDQSGFKGIILGGLLSAGKGINTVTLGASSGPKTTIDLIGVYPELIKNKKQIKAEINQEQEKLQAVLDAQHKVAALPASEKKQMLDARLMLTQEDIQKKSLALNSELENNLAELQLYFENARVTVQKELHTNVFVSIGRDVLHSIRTYGPSKVSVKDYKLLVEPFLP